MKNITGKHHVCGVIGDPIDHTLSPFIHNHLSMWLGCQSVYVPFHVERGNVEAAIQGAHALGIRGLNVTMPHKQEVIAYATSIDKKAKVAGAVNTLIYTPTGYEGYNTDIEGLARALKRNHIQWQGKSVAIIGSGGASYAACLAVIEEARSIHVYNRTKANAATLKAQLEKYYTTPITIHTMEEKGEKAQVIIQTTGVGMGDLKGQMPACAKVLLDEAEVAVDLIYNPWETAFLAYAKACGLQTMNGFDMLYEQAVLAYEKMQDIHLSEATCEAMREKLMKELKL